MAPLHEDLLVFDGLIIGNWDRSLFEDMRRGGLTAANCTCSVWEGFADTMKNIARWNSLFRENADLILKVRSLGDIHEAKSRGKTGIVLGFQNSAAFEDQLGYIEHFKDVGVGVVQLAYNTQNLVGAGCYETNDSGLSDFGREAVSEMNRVGILCDLSHVGAKTSQDTILSSEKPVAYSHCLPAGLKAHPRNKSDEELRFIAEHGGFIGVTMFPPFLKKGIESTVDDYVEAIDYVINLAGEDAVGIGTDFTQGHDRPFFDWITHDKGYARKLTEFGEIVNPAGMRRLGDFPNLTAAMERAGWGEGKIRKIMGENWLGLLAVVWGNLTIADPKIPIDVDEQTGVWTTDGLPMLYVPRHFFVNNHTLIEEALGRDAYAKVLYRAGYKSAYRWCAHEAEVQNLSGMAVFHHYMSRLSRRGWGLFDGSDIDAATGHGRVVLRNSCFVLHVGPDAGRKLCYMCAGWFPGALDWVSANLGRTTKFTAGETGCAGEGHDYCTFDVTPL